MLVHFLNYILVSKKRQFLYILFLVTIACSPKLKSNIEKVFAPLPQDVLIIVLDSADDQSIIGEVVGEIEVKDGGFAVNCTYYETILNLKEIARHAGANVLKIIAHKIPDNRSSCHRIRAKIFKVSNPKRYETQIEWSIDRKLTWNDFKGTPDTINFPNTLALTNSGFGYESGISMLKTGDIFNQSVFNTNESWVVTEGRNDYVLRHEQIHFDITEIYSRKLRKELSDANVTSNNVLKAKPIFEKIFNEM